MPRLAVALSLLALIPACQAADPSTDPAVGTAEADLGAFCPKALDPLPGPKNYAGGPLGVGPGTVIVLFASGGGGRTAYAVNPGQAAVTAAWSIKAAMLGQFMDQSDLAGVPNVPQVQPPRPPRMDELLTWAQHYLGAQSDTIAENQACSQAWGLP